ncbi:septum formation initiator family protein [Streptomyces sp. NBC_01262]|uniref:septum formation initiator family protein n=1 Tax=Streptomyces sp. NBC_01262 TaxID=2903803 RepID=UPI002E34C9B9|nr:septum formation initiator family protein [Streptomyces sp. NBC_01262]
MISARPAPRRPGAQPAARSPFVLLIVLLLAGGLFGLLLLNSAVVKDSFKLDDLQKQTKQLTDEEQALQQDVDEYSAPDELDKRARELGMVPGGNPAFLSPDGRVKGSPDVATAEPLPEPSETPTPSVSTQVSPSAPVSPSVSAIPSASLSGSPVTSPSVTPLGTTP